LNGGAASAHTERRRLVRNLISSYGARGALALSALVLTPYLFRTLGVDGFGTWSVMFTLTTIFSLLELGPSAATTKYVSQYTAEERPDEVEATVGASVLMMGAIGVLAALVLVGFALLFPGLAAEGERDAFRAGMLIMAVAVLIRFPFFAYGAALTGIQRWDLFGASEAATAIGFAVGAVIAIESGAGVFGLAVAYAAALLLGAALFAIFFRRAAPQISMRPRAAQRRRLGSLSRFGSLTLLADAMVFIGLRMDTVLISAIRNAASAAPFAAALKLQSALQSLTLPFLLLLMPMVSELWARGDRDEVVRRMTLSTRVAVQLTLPFALATALFADDLVELWLGGDAPAVTATIIILLMAVQTVTLSVVPAEKALIGIGKVKLIGAIAAFEGISNLALSIALISSYGAVGAALGTLFTAGVVAPVKLPIACRALGTPALPAMRASYVPALLSSLPGVAAMVACWFALEPGAPRLLLGSLLGFSLCAAVALTQVGPRQLQRIWRSRAASADRDPVAIAEQQPVEV